MHIPTIGDLRLAGELLECGCRVCGRHGYFDLATMPLPDELPVMFAAKLSPMLQYRHRPRVIAL